MISTWWELRSDVLSLCVLGCISDSPSSHAVVIHNLSKIYWHAIYIHSTYRIYSMVCFKSSFFLFFIFFFISFFLFFFFHFTFHSFSFPFFFFFYIFSFYIFSFFSFLFSNQYASVLTMCVIAIYLITYTYTYSIGVIVVVTLGSSTCNELHHQYGAYQLDLPLPLKRNMYIMLWLKKRKICNYLIALPRPPLPLNIIGMKPPNAGMK